MSMNYVVISINYVVILRNPDVIPTFIRHSRAFYTALKPLLYGRIPTPDYYAVITRLHDSYYEAAR